MRGSPDERAARERGRGAAPSPNPKCALFDEPADGLVLFSAMFVVLAGAAVRFGAAQAYAVCALLLVAAAASAVLAGRSLAFVLAADLERGGAPRPRPDGEKDRERVQGDGAGRAEPTAGSATQA